MPRSTRVVPVVEDAASVSRGAPRRFAMWCVALFMAFHAMVWAAVRALSGGRVGFGRDTRGILNMGPALAIVGTIVGVFIAIVILAALFPVLIADGLNPLVENMSDEELSTGDDTADRLLRIFALVVAIAVVLGLVGLILVSTRMRNGGNGGGR